MTNIELAGQFRQLPDVLRMLALADMHGWPVYKQLPLANAGATPAEMFDENTVPAYVVAHFANLRAHSHALSEWTPEGVRVLPRARQTLARLFVSDATLAQYRQTTSHYIRNVLDPNAIGDRHCHKYNLLSEQQAPAAIVALGGCAVSGELDGRATLYFPIQLEPQRVLADLQYIHGLTHDTR